ncbi:MAG TPA: hypothetical protein VMG10_16330 [Gemmataceae bacterium]|nr:hypothetical protein [Gemmataceae bacterium]
MPATNINTIKLRRTAVRWAGQEGTFDSAAVVLFRHLLREPAEEPLQTDCERDQTDDGRRETHPVDAHLRQNTL